MMRYEGRSQWPRDGPRTLVELVLFKSLLQHSRVFVFALRGPSAANAKQRFLKMPSVVGEWFSSAEPSVVK